MAWLQNLAGKAEDLLNKIDKNAATVLHESTTKPQDVEQLLHIEENIIEPSRSPSHSPTYPRLEVIDEKHLETTYDVEPEIKSLSSRNSIASIDELRIFEKPLISTPQSLKSSSCNLLEEQIKYEEQISKLESENRELNNQILNVQHLYNELQNEYSSLKADAERAKDGANQAMVEMEQYKIRAQRILKEKEDLIHVKKSSNSGGDGVAAQVEIVTKYNEELKKELTFYQGVNKELEDKIYYLNKEMTSLQQQIINSQNASKLSNQKLHEALLKEREIRAIAEEEIYQKNKDISKIKIDLLTLQNKLTTNEGEIEELKKSAQSQRHDPDMDLRFQMLTDTLMQKQRTLEKTTCERNALKIQLEKLEISYNHLLNQKQTPVSTNVTDEVKSQIPEIFRPSVRDRSFAREAKRAYSTIDTISIRTGVFLRRYPVARVFIFVYVIMIHIWALIILFLYVPRF